MMIFHFEKYFETIIIKNDLKININDINITEEYIYNNNV